eukprot:GFUD01037313.1.p1 GENE.GFUD01037313.1~~GFUD01037313.1.p1  ORF type:complete len:239 (+),score=80.54 GFUD01037313.1:147-863(+)
MSVKVFADLMSQPARAVVIFCRAAGIPHEHVNVRITAGDTKTEEYAKMNPFMKVPVIKDGDFALTESVAMFRYLAREKGVADHWYPNDSKAQARVDEYLEWQHLNTRMMCAGYFLQRWLIPMTTRKFDEKKVAGAKKSMEACLDDFERVWLGGGKNNYVVGDKISVADILAACEMEQPSMAGYDVTQGREVLGEYLRRVKGELNPHYDEVSDVVYKMRDKFGGTVPGVYPLGDSKAKL